MKKFFVSLAIVAMSLVSFGASAASTTALQPAQETTQEMVATPAPVVIGTIIVFPDGTIIIIVYY